MKTTIIRITSSNANKEGQPYIDKRQRPYHRVGIQVDAAEYAGKWLSGFAYQGDPMLSWKAGNSVEIDVEQKGQYLNFRTPRAQAPSFTSKKMDELETRIKVLEVAVEALQNAKVEDIEPNEEESLPF